MKISSLPTMSKRQNISQFFMGNRKFFFSIKYIHNIHISSSRVDYFKHLYTKHMRIEWVLIILRIHWEWFSMGPESAIFWKSEFLNKMANICGRTKVITYKKAHLLSLINKNIWNVFI